MPVMKANGASDPDESASDAEAVPASADPSEGFLERKARWREAARQSARGAFSVEDFNGWLRGNTASEAFRPSSYGLKK